MTNIKIVDTQEFIPTRFEFYLDESYAVKCHEVVLPLQLGTKYRHTLFQAMYGNSSDIAILDCSKLLNLELDPSEIAKAIDNNLPDGWVLDGATGSRKQGILFITQNNSPYSARYLKDSKRISHYSMLWSENHAIVSISDIRIVVLDDEVWENKIATGIADCHGIISADLHESIFSTLNDELAVELDTSGMVQYRLAEMDSWIAKGTILNINKNLSYGEDVDMILPASSFKGKCPELGEVIHYPQLYFGIYKVSKKAKYSTSHSVLGWFKSAKAKEAILNLATKEIEKLTNKRKDVRALARHYLDTVIGTEDGELWGDATQQAEQQAKLEYFSFARILARDTYNQLLLHPKTKSWANKVTANMCKDIALGGFLNATGLMLSTIPTLKGDTVISHDLPTGKYIYWRYPIRCYTDIFLVDVINAKDLLQSYESYAEYFTEDSINQFYLSSTLTAKVKGVAWISSSVAKKCAGDFDGDVGCFMSASRYPELAEEILTWKPIPEAVKPPKNPIKGSLSEVAVKSMSNGVGLISWIITGCRLLGWHWHYSKLAEQLQLEVDGFKSENPVDWDYLVNTQKGVGATINRNVKEGQNCWLQQYKNNELYETKTLRSGYDDIISQLCNLVSDYWEGKQLTDDSPDVLPLNANISPFQCRPLHDFQYLFDQILDVPVSSGYLDRAGKWLADYASAMRATNSLDLETGSAARNQIIQSFVAKAKSITNPNSKLKFAAAIHTIAHRRRDSEQSEHQPTASICFNLFPDEYIYVLSFAPQYQFRLWKHCDKAPSDFGDKVLSRTILPVRVKPISIPTNPETVLYLVHLHTGEKIGRLIEDNTAKNVALPIPETEFVVEINSNISPKSGQLSYHTCRVVPDDTLEF